MSNSKDALVFLIDDDASVREALAWLLRSRRTRPASCWTCAWKAA